MNHFKTPGRYWQTLRYLKPIQLYGRVKFRFVKPAPDSRPTPLQRTIRNSWLAPARRWPSLIGPDTFMLLNESRTLSKVRWDDPAIDKLWRYNQHYFDDLNALGAYERYAWHSDLMERWIVDNPPAVGTGWEPYPTSLRIVNWIKWALSGNALSDDALRSLAIQARWLAKRLEWHLLGNHLFANAKALVFAGRFFNGEEAESWLQIGAEILARELPEQILSDGGQFELSPMYHALAFEDVLDLVNLLRAFGPDATESEHRDLLAACEAHTAVMQRWLKALCHPDNQIAFFNDAAFGIAPTPGELFDYAERLGFEGPKALPDLLWLADSGYARLSQSNAVLLADMARVGPDYIPGHAHADTLSFEFSLGLQRIFVNSGTSVYGTGQERQRQRGTAAHNCVTVANQNSSDVWSGFRVGRRARPISARVRQDGEKLIAEGAHDGYRFLPERPVHDRCWTLSHDSLEIVDRLSNTSISAMARFHLHPDISVIQDGPDHGRLLLPDGHPLRWKTEGASAALEESTWHPEFGISHPNQCIVVSLVGGRATFTLSWG